LPKSSNHCVGCNNITDDRQTDGVVMTYGERNAKNVLVRH